MVPFLLALHISLVRVWDNSSSSKRDGPILFPLGARPIQLSDFLSGHPIYPGIEWNPSKTTFAFVEVESFHTHGYPATPEMYNSSMFFNCSIGLEYIYQTQASPVPETNISNIGFRQQLSAHRDKQQILPIPIRLKQETEYNRS